jgi:NAD(P)-dependent dehydrogenase (short-subunit alcohol dehydrogenase family)
VANEFSGQSALVTGAGSGIGRATALRLAAGGAAVVVVDIEEKAAEAVAEEIVGAGGRAVPFVADVSEPEQVRASVDLAASTFGGLHLAVNNAGITGPLGLLADIDIAGYRRVIEINLNAVFYGMYYEIPAMLASGGGSIVNTSSVLGVVGDPGAVPYVTAKHGIAGMTKAAALGYANRGIRINSVHPGYIDTPLLKVLPEDAYAALTGMHPIGRLGTADEVASTIAFLLSDAASFTTGSQYVLDGGYTAR